jgi:hypothetical protein
MSEPVLVVAKRPARSWASVRRDLAQPHVCQHCGGVETIVVDTRKGVLPAIWRRRECRVCHARWTTWEIVVNPRRLLRMPASK